jgi:hypothetical protein
LAEPARQVAEMAKTWALDRADRLALLAGEPDLSAHPVACQRGRSDHKNEMLQRLRLQGILDLAPPVAPAFERNEILPDREVLLEQLLA